MSEHKNEKQPEQHPVSRPDLQVLSQDPCTSALKSPELRRLSIAYELSDEDNSADLYFESFNDNPDLALTK